MTTGGATAEEIVRALDLAPHPEGGFYRESFRDAPTSAKGRAASTAIYYLLAAGQCSAWHRIDAAEIWHFYAGDALELSLCADGEAPRTRRLGADLLSGERPQIVVPPRVWQAAKPLGAWTLVGCTVAPGFEFAHFELAPPGRSFE
jgi:predicted cupin superfamily sugar epimerase